MDLKDSQILIIGTSGQVARSFADLALANVSFVDRSALDFSDPASVQVKLDRLYSLRSFHVVINTAAYTQVDKAEQEPEMAMKVNAESVAELARWCVGNDIFLVNYSTDYVFPGDGDQPWLETDSPAPLNVYGHTKRQGELQTLESGAKGLIIRTSWVHSPYGKNFVRTMLGLALDPIRIVSDQFGAPTYAQHLAEATLKLVSLKIGQVQAMEIFNITNSGETNWSDFAFEIFRLAVEKGIREYSPKVSPIPHDQYKTLARRPLNSRLSQQKLLKEAGFALPSWQSGLESCITKIKEMAK